MNISLLIKAADYLESREKETDHEYALSYHHRNRTKDIHNDHLRKKIKLRLSPLNRTVHNELEKNRRAYLRKCLQDLREALPQRNISSKYTMLELLIQSRKYINEMVSANLHQLRIRKILTDEREHLLRRLDILDSKTRVRPGPSVSSECSRYSAGSSSPDQGMAEYDEESISYEGPRDTISML